MAITKLTHDTDIPSSDDSAQILFICPVCKTEKSLHFPKSIIKQAGGLTTMSIAKDLVCDHQFQAFVDKNYVVRGYQRVDFEFAKTKLDEKILLPHQNEDDLFENLILEGDFLEYNPKKKCEDKIQHTSKEKIKTLQEIYDDFWEFIDDNNELFSKLIKNDVRRSGSKDTLDSL